MLTSYQLFTLFCFTITLTNTYNISSCIPNSTCQCHLTQYSLKLLNCTHRLTNLVLSNSNVPENLTKIIAPNVFIRWPTALCKYSNLQILDLSGSYFNSQTIDLSCLKNLIHLNLSKTELSEIPNFERNVSQHLQILDLSNNHIKRINGNEFRTLDNLISLFLQNNPIETIEHVEDLFSLTNIELINLVSSNLDVNLKQLIDLNQWNVIAKKWSDVPKSFSMRMKNIPLQKILPNPDKVQTNSIDSMKIVLKKLINSTFITLFNTPKCVCSTLRIYQRIFSFVDYQNKYSSPLFQSTTCLMTDRITHARLFDRRTYIDLRCPLLEKMSYFPHFDSSAASFKNRLVASFSFLWIFIVLS